MTVRLPSDFVIGAATSAHQIEGGNRLNDCWHNEHAADSLFAEPSGTACGSWERWREDVAIVADLGLDAYRFSLEWSRIQPTPGEVCREALEHYLAIVDECGRAGVQPVVTLHHFTNPIWMARAGGWANPDVVDRFDRYVQAVLPVLEAVDLVWTLNEPSITAEWNHRLTLPPRAAADPRIFEHLLAAHRHAVDLLHADKPSRQVGLTLALNDWEILPGGDAAAARLRELQEDRWLRAVRGDDVVGVQTYTSVTVGRDGLVPPSADEPLTLTGWRIRPAAVAAAVRHAARVSGLPVVVTENGIATDDDELRWTFICQALSSLTELLDEGVDVRGWFYWSLLDNFEWLLGYAPTFGLVEVDRASLSRTPRASAVRLAEALRAGTWR